MLDTVCLYAFFLFIFQNKTGPPLHPYVQRTGGATTRSQAKGGKGKKGKKGKRDQYDLIVNIDLVSNDCDGRKYSWIWRTTTLKRIEEK
jgi:hypothetical protein